MTKKPDTDIGETDGIIITEIGGHGVFVIMVWVSHPTVDGWEMSGHDKLTVWVFFNLGQNIVVFSVV